MIACYFLSKNDVSILLPPISDLSMHQERISNVAYNITNGLCTPVKDQSAPVYITIGDGGNLEGLATK